jgi:hypothetical protein
LTLRHQLNVLRRKSPKWLAFSNFDRLIFAGLYRIAPRIVDTLVTVKPETVTLASCWFLLVLAMEVARSQRQTEGGARNPAVSPRHEPRQPAVGRSPDPWRTPQARRRNWPDLGRQVHGKVQETPIARVEDVPPQSCRWDRLDGPLCRSDTLVSAVLRLAHSMPRPPPNLMAGGDGTPERRMDGPTTYRSLWLGMDAEVNRPRSRFCLWRNFHRRLRAMGIRDRPAAIAMAEWPYGTVDWLDLAGMS